jgi:succinate dehydrogenase hydrophobic anchor subunit
MRDPETIGYLPWIAHRLSAVALVPLLAMHLGVQLYPSAGFSVFLEWGIYRPLLGLTLGILLLHAFLGIRSTVIETRLSERTMRVVVWAVGVSLLVLLVARLIA